MPTIPPRATPTHDIQSLIQLGYASESRRLRAAAGRVDEWLWEYSFDMEMVEEFGFVIDAASTGPRLGEGSMKVAAWVVDALQAAGWRVCLGACEWAPPDDAYWEFCQWDDGELSSRSKAATNALHRALSGEPIPERGSPSAGSLRREALPF
jgi:hypothetical protein